MPTTDKKKIIKRAKLGAAYGMGPARLAKAITSPQQKITRKNAAKLIKNLSASLPALPKAERDPENPFRSAIATLRGALNFYRECRARNPGSSKDRIVEYREAIAALQEGDQAVRVEGKVIEAPGLYAALRDYCAYSDRRRDLLMRGEFPARGTPERERMNRLERRRVQKLRRLTPVLGKWVNAGPSMSLFVGEHGNFRVTWSR